MRDSRSTSRAPSKSNRRILPYYHPTSVIVVDDNRMFLHTLDLRMPGEMAYELFDDPRLAIERVNEPLGLSTIPERCVQREGIAWKGVIEFDLSLIEEEIKNTARFRRTSVVVVDYAMPQMNGLEFCAAIKDPSVRKVMLTGVADEKVAVRAFNDGLIDRFVSKNDRTTLDLVVAFAQDLQRAYFIDQQRALQSSLEVEPPSFLEDPAVQARFEDVRDRVGGVEHYLVADPPGLMLLTRDGLKFLLIVASAQYIASTVEFANRLYAPSAVIAELTERRKVGYFFESPESPESPASWSEYLHDATMVAGQTDWLVALVSSPPIDIDFDPDRFCYRAFLEQVDRGI